MSYLPGTILKRKVPLNDFTEYNEVKVIGEALVNSGAPRSSEWEGGSGNFWSITPITFGSPIDRPLGEIERDYEVVSIPDAPNLTDRTPEIKRVPGPSPEEIFTKDYESRGEKKAPIRVETPLAAFAKAHEEPEKSEANEAKPSSKKTEQKPASD